MSIPATGIPLILGAHIWVALEGATLSAAGSVIKPAGDSSSYTTAGSTAKPASSDTAWVKLGRCENVSMSRDDGETIEIWTPSPGVLNLSEKIRVAQKRTYKVKCRDVSPLSIQLAFRTTALSGSSTQFNPGEGAASQRGWVKMQFYTHENEEAIRVEFWADIDIDGELTFDAKATTDSNFAFTELYNVLNTGTLPTALS